MTFNLACYDNINLFLDANEMDHVNSTIAVQSNVSAAGGPKIKGGNGIAASPSHAAFSNCTSSPLSAMSNNERSASPFSSYTPDSGCDEISSKNGSNSFVGKWFLITFEMFQMVSCLCKLNLWFCPMYQSLKNQLGNYATFFQNEPLQNVLHAYIPFHGTSMDKYILTHWMKFLKLLQLQLCFLHVRISAQV